MRLSRIESRSEAAVRSGWYAAMIRKLYRISMTYLMCGWQWRPSLWAVKLQTIRYFEIANLVRISLGGDAGWKPHENTSFQKKNCGHAWTEMDTDQPVQHISTMMLCWDCVLAGLCWFKKMSRLHTWNHCSKFAIRLSTPAWVECQIRRSSHFAESNSEFPNISYFQSLTTWTSSLSLRHESHIKTRYKHQPMLLPNDETSLEYCPSGLSKSDSDIFKYSEMPS